MTPTTTTGSHEATSDDSKFPCSVTIHTPFPSARLAQIALTAISVDEELSPLVRRHFELTSPAHVASQTEARDPADDLPVSDRSGGVLRDPALVPQPPSSEADSELSVLVTTYRATTHRMLRVSTNGFFESLGVVISTMRDLDEDMLGENWTEQDEKQMYIGDEAGVLGSTDKVAELRDLDKVQGLEERGRLDAGAAAE